MWVYPRPSAQGHHGLCGKLFFAVLVAALDVDAHTLFTVDLELLSDVARADRGVAKMGNAGESNGQRADLLLWHPGRQ
ncbi:hypothetical protein D3C81_2264170 [compost metagenome]